MKKNNKTIGLLVVTSILACAFIYNQGFTIKVKADENVPFSEAQIIREKMMNSIDNYDNVKGSFTYMVSSGESSQVEFEVQEGNKPGSNILVKEKAGSIVSNRISDEGFILFKNENNKTFEKQKKVPPQVTYGTRKFINDEGKTTFVYRQDPATPTLASNVTFPQAFAFWFDDEQNNYKVTGHKNLFGRDVTVIEGLMPTGMLDRAATFTIWVDSETGILLGLESTKTDGTSFMSIKLNDIVIDSKQKTLLKSTPKTFDTSDPIGYNKIEKEDLKAKVNSLK